MATFNGNGRPKTRQIYHIKSAAVLDLAKATNVSSATVVPSPSLILFFLIDNVVPSYEGRIN